MELIADFRVCSAGERLSANQVSNATGLSLPIGVHDGPGVRLQRSWCKSLTAACPHDVQAAVLRIFDVKMAAFKMRLLAGWDADGETALLCNSKSGVCLCPRYTQDQMWTSLAFWPQAPLMSWAVRMMKMMSQMTARRATWGRCRNCKCTTRLQ